MVISSSPSELLSSDHIISEGLDMGVLSRLSTVAVVKFSVPANDAVALTLSMEWA